MLKLLSRFILIILLSSSCVSSYKKYPSWYITPPKNDSNYLYGVGEGFDPDEAKIAALNDASSKLRTIVSSKTQSEFENDGYSSSSSFSQKISNQVEKIAFNNYEVLKTEQIKGSFVSLIGIKSQILINAYKNDIEKTNREVAGIENLSSSKLEKRENLLKIVNIHKEIEPKIRILESIDSSYDIKSQLSKMSYYLDEYNKINSELEFRISCDDSDIENYLLSKLSQSGLRISKSGKQELKVNYKWILQEAVGIKMAKLIMNVKYIDENGKIIKSENIESSGRSVSDYELAKKQCLKH